MSEFTDLWGHVLRVIYLKIYVFLRSPMVFMAGTKLGHSECLAGWGTILSWPPFSAINQLYVFCLLQPPYKSVRYCKCSPTIQSSDFIWGSALRPEWNIKLCRAKRGRHYRCMYTSVFAMIQKINGTRDYSLSHQVAYTRRYQLTNNNGAIVILKSSFIVTYSFIKRSIFRVFNY